MSRKPNLEPLDGLSPELARLDRELSGLGLDERPSFGPELRNELARAWPGMRRRRPSAWRRHALAASVAALAVTGLLVPPARAALVDGVLTLVDTLQGAAPVDDDSPVVIIPLRERREEVDRPGVVAVRSEPEPEAEAAALPAEPEPLRMPAFQPGTSTLPRLLDPAASADVVRTYSPDRLQAAGVGGTATVLLWVREDGSVDRAEVALSSGVAELDRAAVSAARALRFDPARRNGVPVGTWVEFDLVFEGAPPVVATTAAAIPAAAGVSLSGSSGDGAPPDSGAGADDGDAESAPLRLEAREMLLRAMGGDEPALEARFGSMEHILSGDPPSGMDPLSWRREVTEALDDARMEDPANPATYLALARIRRKQGLRDEAYLLVQEGARHAAAGAISGAGSSSSPRLAAELAWESGRLARENWLGWRALGDLPASALPAAACPSVPASTGGVAGPATVLAWNFNCAARLRQVLAAEVVSRRDGEDFREAMLRHLERAVVLHPGHVGANTLLILEGVDAGAWEAVLRDGTAFARATGGHPHALLLQGLALARLGRVDEADEQFRAALAGLSAEVRSDLAGLELVAEAVPGARELSPDRVEAAWAPLDPVFSTAVNERLVEHRARAAYALLRFGSLRADAARSWVRFGRPDGLHAFGAGTGIRLELWDYGEGPALAFYRPAATQNGALTPETEEYLADLGPVYPAGLRGGSPWTPAALHAELVETPALFGNGTDLQIRFDVPAALSDPGADGDLQVGVFLIGYAGAPIRVQRWTVERDAGGVDLTVPMDAQVREAVVELLDPATGSVYAARRGVELQPGAAR